MFIIKWRNKYSGETGFVESISSKEGHFTNTFEEKEAKGYKSAAIAKRMVSTLTAIGEADNNDFEIVKVGA
jgi:hypothetical protein